jgi:hypothetical protein
MRRQLWQRSLSGKHIGANFWIRKAVAVRKRSPGVRENNSGGFVPLNVRTAQRALCNIRMRLLLYKRHPANMLHNNKLTEQRLAQTRKSRYHCTCCQKSAYGRKRMLLVCGHCLPESYVFPAQQMLLFIPRMVEMELPNRKLHNSRLSETRLKQMRKRRYQCETCKNSAYGPKGWLLVCGCCLPCAYIAGGQQMLLSMPWLVEAQTKSASPLTERNGMVPEGADEYTPPSMRRGRHHL